MSFPAHLQLKTLLSSDQCSRRPFWYEQNEKLKELVDFSKKTMIFCDTIGIGKAISRELGVPYIYGETTNRLREIDENKVVCVSRVADLGASVKNLQRIVEVDFLFGSRQQELHRTGRLLHADIRNGTTSS